MTKRITALALATLMLPALAAADTAWRWQDSSGGLHYSNVPAHVPAHAVRVDTRLGEIRGGVPAPDMRRIEADMAAARKARSQAPVTAGVPPLLTPWPYCTRLAVPIFLTLQGNELADQVKEAALLDALRVPWRNGICLM
jgi:hypothetical protein